MRPPSSCSALLMEWLEGLTGCGCALKIIKHDTKTRASNYSLYSVAWRQRPELLLQGAHNSQAVLFFVPALQGVNGPHFVSCFPFEGGGLWSLWG